MSEQRGRASASLRFVRVNRACETLLGWPREALAGKNDFDLWPREQAEFFIRKDRETLKVGRVDIDEEPIQTRHHGTRVLCTKKVPIVEAHGGHIWAESTLGRGSTFFFSIPKSRPTGDQPSGVSA